MKMNNKESEKLTRMSWLWIMSTALFSMASGRSYSVPTADIGSWDEAKAYCEGEELSLAVILSEDDQTAAAEACTDAGTSCWIGLRDDTWVGNYGSLGSSDYEKWVSSPGSNECVQLQGSGNKWKTAACDSNHRFLCSDGDGTTSSSNSNTDSDTSSTTSTTTNTGGSRSYARGPDKVSWDDAKAYCASTGDTPILAVVLTLSEMEAAAKACDGEGCWIGLTDEDSEGDFEWEGGFGTHGEFDYSNWRSDSPHDGDNNLNCVQLQGSGRWRDDQCSASRYPLCSDASSYGNVVVIDTDADVDSNCPTAFESYEELDDIDDIYYDFCRDPPSNKYHVGPKLVSYDEAVAYCANYGGLAYIENAFDNAQAKTVCLEEDTVEANNGCWIGLRWNPARGNGEGDTVGNFGDLNEADGDYYWAKDGPNGCPPTWTRWADDNPDTGSSKNKYCVRIRTNNENGRWDNQHCELGQMYPLCNNPDYEHEAPETGFAGENKDYEKVGWEGSGGKDPNGNVIDLTPAAISEKYFAWNRANYWCDAKAYCEAWGSTLATILDDDDNTEAELVCNTARDIDHFGLDFQGNDHESDGCYIGLTDWRVEGRWEWLDGSAVNTYGFHSKNGAGDPTKVTYGKTPWKFDMPRDLTGPNRVGDGQDDKDFVNIGASNSVDNDGKWYSVDYGKFDNTPNNRYPICNNNGIFKKSDINVVLGSAFIDSSSDAVVGGLNAGAFAGVLIAILFVVLLVAFGVWMWRRRRNNKRQWDVEVVDDEEESVDGNNVETAEVETAEVEVEVEMMQDVGTEM